MNRLNLHAIWEKRKEIDWKLFLFLVLVMNVKLVVKVLAILILLIIERKSVSVKTFYQKPHLLFYLSISVVALINYLLQLSGVNMAYNLVMLLSLAGWLMPALAGFFIYQLVQRGDTKRLHQTVTLFFLVHVIMIFASLVPIICEIGELNPYAYKGLNQKYFMSTGDYIRGVTFDDAIATAMIAGFGVLYFLSRHKILYAILCMAAVLVVFSNLTTIFLLLVFVFLFIFYSDRIQKSILVVFGCMIIVFITNVSPQNNEYIVSFFYKLAGKTYAKPGAQITRDELKQMPDSSLSPGQRKEKWAMRYLDSVSAVSFVKKTGQSDTPMKQDPPAPPKEQIAFNEYLADEQEKEKENRYAAFLKTQYTTREKDSLEKEYNWEKPGKLTAALQLKDFFKKYPAKIALGEGAGNFSSRTAFKAAALGVNGSYPAKYRYVNPLFKDAHLYTYLFYRAQWQLNHTAANKPDSVYFQLAGEYGLVGVLLFAILYVIPLAWKSRRLPLGLPALLLLLLAFSSEYWFEQLSIVVLFELLFFLDLKTARQEGRSI